MLGDLQLGAAWQLTIPIGGITYIIWKANKSWRKPVPAPVPVAVPVP